MKFLKYMDELNERNKAHQISAFAGQMAYFFVLSFFPLLIFILSIISKLNINYDFAVQTLKIFLPTNISILITEFVGQTITTEGSAVLSISGLLMLYSASKAVSALQRAINTSYEVVETRNFFVVKFLGIFYTLLFTVIIILSLMIPSLAKDLIDFISSVMAIEINKNFLYLLYFMRNSLLFSSFIIVIVSIYVFLPNKKMHLQDIYPGALFAIVGFVATNFMFSKVVVVLTDYSILYGSLSAVVAFMIWVYFLASIIILGAEINAIHILKHIKPLVKFDNL